MTSSDSVFDSRGWVFQVNLSDEDIAESELPELLTRATVKLGIGPHSSYGILSTKDM